MLKVFCTAMIMSMVVATASAADNYSLFALGHGKASGAPDAYNMTVAICVSAPDLVKGKKLLEEKIAAISDALKKAGKGQVTAEFSLPIVLNDQNRAMITAAPDGSMPPWALLSIAAVTTNVQYMQNMYFTLNSLEAVNELKDAVFNNEAYLVIRPTLSPAKETELRVQALAQATRNAMNKAKVMAATAGIGKIEFAGIEEVNNPANQPAQGTPGMTEVESTVRVFFSFMPNQEQGKK